MKRQQYFFLALLLGVQIPWTVESWAQSSFECQKILPSSGNEKLMRDVDECYQGLTQLEAQFVQDSYFVGLGTERTSSGKVYFKKPGQMDWSYESPEVQRFVSNGDTFWFYQPQLKQVTITDFKQSFQSDLPVSFLLGVGQLRKDFTVERTCETVDGIALELAPIGDDASLSKFTLLVSKGTLFPLGARVLDVGGNETSIKFNSLSLNSQLDTKHFDFAIPKGVDILDQRQSKGQKLTSATKSATGLGATQAPVNIQNNKKETR